MEEVISMHDFPTPKTAVQEKTKRLEDFRASEKVILIYECPKFNREEGRAEAQIIENNPSKQFMHLEYIYNRELFEIPKKSCCIALVTERIPYSQLEVTCSGELKTKRCLNISFPYASSAD